MAQKPTPAENAAPDFEGAIVRLEEIVAQMEENRLPLEQLIERFEEGSKLVKICQEKIETAERRIEIITRTAAGKPQVTPFESPAASEPLPSTPARAREAAADDVSLF